MAHDQINILHRKCMENIAGGKGSRPDVEASIELLDHANSDLEREVLIVMAGYSKHLRRDTAKIVEDYYDRMTELFSEFDRGAIGADFASKQHTLSKKHSQKFIDDVSACIRDSCPPQKAERRWARRLKQFFSFGCCKTQ